jgi:2-C-methyl-D-erythritol 2,4-cyclodiphosphate synthase
MNRIGIGYDIHKVTEGRRLVLGGIEIPWDKGLSGHSDADVLLHALCDALLGAVGLGDIGQHFPPSDPKWKDYDSREFVKSVYTEVKARGWRVINVDSVIIAQAPRLSSYYGAIREGIATLLELSPDAVSVKATTPEGLGALGAGEGIAAYVVVLLAGGESRQCASTSR